MVGALGVAGCVAPVEADGQADVPLLREPHQALAVGEFVRDRLVDKRRDARLQQPPHDLGMRGGGRVHERRVEVLGEQVREVRVAALRRDVEAVGDPGEGGGRPGVQMHFDARLSGEHRQIRLHRDIAESDAADLHKGLLRVLRGA
jgi:hypothetical protein